MLDFELINRIVLVSYQSLVQQWIPGGGFSGKEYIVKNPNRPDNAAGSFSINTETGIWKDFADGIGGKDPISLYTYIRRIKPYEAAKELAEMLHIDASKPSSLNQKKPKQEWIPVLPVPPGSPQHPATYPSFENGSWVEYPITDIWTYKSAEGNILGYDVKVINKEGKKKVVPLTYCKNKSGEYSWRFIHFKVKRPLYNLDVLSLNPDAIVIVVEGCKCARALQDLLNKINNKSYVVTTWPQGCQGAKYANWSMLKGRNVYVWRIMTGSIMMINRI